MQSLTLQLPVSRDCLSHRPVCQQTPYLTSARAVRRAARPHRLARRALTAAKWKGPDSPSKSAVKALEQTDTAGWREKGDTAYVAQQQVLTRTRLQQFFTTQYDQEIFAVLLPALLAIFLDPVMMLVDTGGSFCLPSSQHTCKCQQFSCQHEDDMLSWTLLESQLRSHACSHCWSVGDFASSSCRTQQPALLLLHCVLQLSVGGHYSQSCRRSGKQ